MFKRVICAIAIACAIVGCDRIVIETVHHDQAVKRLGSVTCDAGPGYCYECGLGFNGYKCDYSFKYSCDGTRPALLLETPVTRTWESGTKDRTTQITTLELMGECSR